MKKLKLNDFVKVQVKSKQQLKKLFTHIKGSDYIMQRSTRRSTRLHLDIRLNFRAFNLTGKTLVCLYDVDGELEILDTNVRGLNTSYLDPAMVTIKTIYPGKLFINHSMNEEIVIAKCGGIKFGCTYIPFKTAKRIAKALDII